MEEGSSDGQRAERRKKKRHSRVLRACDGCRVRKTKCDGAQPCDACKVFERECSYSSSQAHKFRSAERSRILETRLRCARAYVEEIQQSLPSHARCDVDALFSLPTEPPTLSSESTNELEPDEQGGKLENMVGDQGRMSSLDHKKAEFYGGSSGFAFLHKTKQFFDQENGYQSDAESDTTQGVIAHLFDSPLPDRQALDIDVPISHLLPSRRTASQLLRVVFDRVYPLFNFIHEPLFQEQTNRIYEREPMDFEDSDHDFLPLFYVVIGLGFLFAQETHRQYGCGTAVSQAMRHFIAARNMVDITRCRNLLSLQVLICFVLFLVSTARIATSHTYVGLCVTSAMRLGLSSFAAHSDNIPKLERDVRRRVFCTVVKLDIYTAQVLGLPTLTNLQEISEAGVTDGADDLFPLALPHSPEAISAISAAVSAKHLELLLIIERSVKRVHSQSGTAVSGDDGRRVLLVNCSVVIEAQREFKRWRETLYDFFHLEDKEPILTTISYDLEMVYNFGHIVLYRPFLHYLARARSDKPPDKRQLRCALACIKVAHSTILRSQAMLQADILSPSSWHSVYTVFLSVVALIFFLATHADAREAVTVRQTAESGIQILASTACQDAGSRRCLDVLRVLVRRLSHLVTLDVDQIQSKSESLCQKRDISRNEERPEPSARGVETVAADIPGLDCVASTSASDSMDFSTLYLDSSTWHPPMPHEMAGESSQMPQDETFLNQWPAFLDFDLGGQSSAEPYTQTDMGQEPSYALSGTMEIPFADAFSWPFQGHSTGYASYRGGSAGLSLGIPNVQGPLSSDDIMAFMQINPGEDAFA